MFTEEQKQKLQKRVGRMYKRDGVPDTLELRRVLALPRRDWQRDLYEGFTVEQLAEQLSTYLRKPGVEVADARLWITQAKALQEAHDYGGLFGDFPVGAGKTLLSFLVPTLMGAERPLLVIPAKLREKTERDFRDLTQAWVTHPNYAIVNYEKLSRGDGSAFLERVNPDLLVLDEAHKVRNPRAAVTRKIDWWMSNHKKTRMVAMSGTIVERSLLDSATILKWALPLILYPLPLSDLELAAWAAAVDLIKLKSAQVPEPVGALMYFCNDEEKKLGRKGVRQAIRRRMKETPGIVSSDAPDVRASLNINLQLVEGYNSETHKLAQQLLDGIKPNGDPVTDKDLASRWATYRTLTSGFWYEWNPPPPAGWREARSAWKAFVSSTMDYAIQHSLKGLESEALVTQAVSRGDTRIPRMQSKGQPLLEAWHAIRDTYKEARSPVWVDDRIIHFVDDWARNNTGIIWVNEVALGQRLEADLGLAYYHNKGLDAQKRFIEDADNDRCIVASVKSNGEGRNLQFKWSNNLVISPMPTGSEWEQTLGRTHRPKQEADEVNFDVVFGCLVEWECWSQAMADAEFATDINNRKKLTYASVNRDFNLVDCKSVLWQKPSSRE